MIRSPASRPLGPASISLARYLSGLLGLSLATAACGGNVVFETGKGEGGTGGENSGGGGGSTTSQGGAGNTSVTTTATTSVSTAATGVTTGTGGGGFWQSCSPPPISTQEYDPYLGDPEMLYVCIASDPGEACLSHDHPNVYQAIDPLVFLYGDECSGDVGRTLFDVPCGPDPESSLCCYAARTIPWQDWCEEGRPFLVDGVARTAGVTARADWCSGLMPDLSGLSAAERAALSEAWLRSALMEHASVASFARFALELLAVGAPAALVLDAQRAIGDEVRHAQACFALASAYAGRSIGPSVLPIDGATGRADLVSIAMATVREGCVGETVASLSARAELNSATDPAVREALAQIAGDEAFHAGLAWRFIAWAVAQGGEPVREAVARAFEEEALRAEGQSGAAVEETFAEAMRRHGRLTASEARDVRREAMSAVVLPCARALLSRAPEMVIARNDAAPAVT